MNAEFGYFVDHLPSIITAIFGGVIMLRQDVSTRRAKKAHAMTEEIRYDLQNGIGEKIAAQAVKCMRPALDAAADKVVRTAEETASALADRRKG